MKEHRVFHTNLSLLGNMCSAKAVIKHPNVTHIVSELTSQSIASSNPCRSEIVGMKSFSLILSIDADYAHYLCISSNVYTPF